MNLLARALVRLVGYLPLMVLHVIAHVLGSVLWMTDNKRKRVALQNLSACMPELTVSQRRTIARASLINELKTMLELMRIWKGPSWAVPRMIREVTGEALVDEAKARGKGVMLLTPHIGNPEVSGFYHSWKRGDIHGVYKPQKGLLDQLAFEGRSRFGAELIPTDGRPVGPQVQQWLKDNQAVLSLPDQDPPEGRGVFAPFFGVQAHTPRLVSRTAQDTDCSVLFLYAERLPWGRGFNVHYEPVDSGLMSDDPVVAATALNKGIEALIRRQPAGYWWSYERFRRRPPGEPVFYAKTK